MTIIIYRNWGYVGDIESLPYIESVRQLKWELGENNSMVIHLNFTLFSNKRRIENKPSQHSVRMLMESGIMADVLFVDQNIESRKR